MTPPGNRSFCAVTAGESDFAAIALPGLNHSTAASSTHRPNWEDGRGHARNPGRSCGYSRPDVSDDGFEHAPPVTTTIQIMAVLFLATVIRSAFGFGEALIAVPLLALVMPVEAVAPIAVLMSITIAFLVLLKDWRHVHVRSVGWLVLPTFVGIPLGLMVLKTVAEPIVKAGLATVIIGFSSYSLLSRRRHEVSNDRLAWLFGFAAGLLGGAYGMNGPPLVVYGSLRGWSPQQFRATLQGYFLRQAALE
jgi:hypothetical protein